MNGHIHACPKCYRRVPCDYPGCDYVEADLTLDDGTLCGPHVICDDCGTPPAPQGTAPAAKRIYGAALTAKRARPGGGQVAAVAHCIRHVSEDAAEALVVGGLTFFLGRTLVRRLLLLLSLAALLAAMGCGGGSAEVQTQLVGAYRVYTANGPVDVLVTRRGAQ